MGAMFWLAQNTTNGMMQAIGVSKIATSRRPILEEETKVNTTVRRVIKVANPRRQSLAHQIEPKTTLKPVPIMMKINQKTQLKRERTNILLRTKRASLRITLLTTKSTPKVTAKRAVPNKSPLTNPFDEEKTSEDSPVTIQMAAMATIVCDSEGRKNRDE
jgi:hypothetical protein